MGLLDTLRQSFGGKRKTGDEALVDWVTIRGHGVEAVPLSPFSATQVDDGSILFGPVTPRGPERPAALLVPGRQPSKIGLYLADEQDEIYALGSTEEETTALVLPSGLRDAKGLLSAFRQMPIRAEGWFVRTLIYEIPFLPGFTLRGQEPAEAHSEPFDFVHEGGGQVSIFGPFTGRGKIPRADQFAPQNRESADQGKLIFVREVVPYFDFAYRDGAKAMKQRLYEVIADPLSYTVYFVRVTAPKEAVADLLPLTDLMIKGFIANER